MRLELYIVYDQVAGEGGPVFTAKNIGVALRNYRSLMKGTVDPESYELRRVGIYDNELGQIIHMDWRVIAEEDEIVDGREEEA